MGMPCEGKNTLKKGSVVDQSSDFRAAREREKILSGRVLHPSIHSVIQSINNQASISPVAATGS
jgi:hypothetical protein